MEFGNDNQFQQKLNKLNKLKQSCPTREHKKRVKSKSNIDLTQLFQAKEAHTVK